MTIFMENYDNENGVLSLCTNSSAKLLNTIRLNSLR